MGKDKKQNELWWVSASLIVEAQDYYEELERRVLTEHQSQKTGNKEINNEN